MSPHPSRAAFGVIELLVVVVVVAVLALLLLPAVSGMRERSQTAACAANLRQIGVAMLLYANEHQGQYPPNRSNQLYRDEKFTAGVHWQDYLLVYFPNVTYKQTPHDYRHAGPFWCPADVKRKERLPQHSYGVHANRGGGIVVDKDGQPTAPVDPVKVRVAAEPNPSQSLYLIDATRPDLSTSNITHKAWPFGSHDVDVIPEGSYNTVRVDFRHGNRANALFIDGHVRAFTPRELNGQRPEKIVH